MSHLPRDFERRGESSPELKRALQEHFGFDAFRPLQEAAVRAAIGGRDVLVVMPTGAGKSLCYQLPAALQPGVTLVVSPLIALMRDQVQALQARPSFARLGCACITSMQSLDEQKETIRGLREGHLRVVYIAPERFRSPAFVQALAAVPIGRFVVDEAHCISEWGHDFRPDYLSLQKVVESLGSPPLMALTATAAPRVQASISHNLKMRNPEVLIGGFNRPNLHYSVHQCTGDRDRAAKLKRALPKLAGMGGSGLIYVSTRKQAEEVAGLAMRALEPVGKAACAYHAGMSASDRNSFQHQWLSGQLHLLVATNAFGMGIDKPDVRYVVHWGYPESLESYYQEAGRAGRDGLRSRCTILRTAGDWHTRKWFIDHETVTASLVEDVYGEILTNRTGNESFIAVTGRPEKSGVDGNAVRLALRELEQAELVRRVVENTEAIQVDVLQNRLSRETFVRIANTLELRRQGRYRRLQEMIAYCKTNHCRRRTVLRYFGDQENPKTAGFCCDNCDRR